MKGKVLTDMEWYEVNNALGKVEDKLRPITYEYCTVCKKGRLIYSFDLPDQKHRCLACLSLLELGKVE